MNSLNFPFRLQSGLFHSLFIFLENTNCRDNLLITYKQGYSFQINVELLSGCDNSEGNKKLKMASIRTEFDVVSP